MNRSQEKLLVAALAGIIIAGAAAFAVGPAMAETKLVDAPAQVTGVRQAEALNLRRAPGQRSQAVGVLMPETAVWVDRCVAGPKYAADWCLVQTGETYGWVDSRYLSFAYQHAI